MAQGGERGMTGRGIRLSVIVPVYNAAPFLSRCLRSLTEQDIDSREYEVLVVDDGSDDCSMQIVGEFALRHSNIVLHSQQHRGVAAARNVGIDRARGRYLLFVDADDYVAPRILGELLELVEQEQVEVLAFDHVRVGLQEDRPPGPSAAVRSTARPIHTGRDHMAAHPYTSEAWGYLLSREHVLNAGATFDERCWVAEDVSFTATVVSAARRMTCIPLEVYHYVQHQGSLMHARDSEHTKRLVADYERVVFGLERLRQDRLAAGPAPVAFFEMLERRQQAFVFFLIARVVRSDLPLRPFLPDVLARFGTIGMYPMTKFPGQEFPGARYTALTYVFNRRRLLWAFAGAMRLPAGGKRLLESGARTARRH